MRLGGRWRGRRRAVMSEGVSALATSAQAGSCSWWKAFPSKTAWPSAPTSFESARTLGSPRRKAGGCGAWGVADLVRRLGARVVEP